MKRILATVLLASVLSGQARAEIMTASSIEWLSCSSEIVVLGKIKEITITKGVHSVIYEDCVVQIDEVLKGNVKGKELTFCLRTLCASPSAKAFMNSKEGVLLFLCKSKGHGPEAHLDNRYVPTSAHHPFSIMDLSNPPEDVFSKEMRILTDKKELLKAVRDWADQQIAHSLRSEAPFDSPIHRRLRAGNACSLIVPAEEKYRKYFLELARSQEPQERQKAASELYKFPGKESELVLRELLKDETENRCYYAADTISTVEFGVRGAAYRSLKALGKPVPEITLERKPTEEEQRSLRKRYWRKSFTAALPERWEVVATEDGDTRQVERGNTTSVIVTCRKGNSHCKFILIPKEWNEKDFPAAVDLGINGRHSPGARHFFLEGTLPQALKEKLVRYFGLD